MAAASVSNVAIGSDDPASQDRPPRRWLHVAAGNLYGGVERMLTTIARHQAAASDSVHDFALCFPGRLRDELQANGATTHDLGPARVSRPWTVLQARHRLRKVISAGRYDAVLFHGCWPLATLGWQSRRTDCQSVLWVHDAITGRHWLERAARRRAIDRFIGNSQWVLESARQWRPDVPGEVLCCPVELPAEPKVRTGHVRRELECAVDTIVIVQVSRLEAWKGHRRLIDAARRLAAEHHALARWEVWFVGGPQRPHEAEYLQTLKTMAAEHQLTDRVRWLGQRSDVPAVLADADIFCQPNESPEPLGLVFLEAMAQGLPVITTDFGGAREIVPSSAGRLTSPGNQDELTATLARLIADSVARSALSVEGPAHARRLADPLARLQDLETMLAESPIGRPA